MTRGERNDIPLKMGNLVRDWSFFFFLSIEDRIKRLVKNSLVAFFLFSPDPLILGKKILRLVVRFLEYL